MYTVQSGDTLQGIAASLWGDANLWYKIAEVNGLTAESALIEGQPLIIPVGVQRNSNTAETFKPYDPLEVLGNVSPTSPSPKKNKCGAMGQILIAVIAIVVTIYTGMVLGPGLLHGVVAGAAGSIVSQSVGVATGIQDKFSWNAVALSAISAGASGGGGVGGAVASNISNQIVQKFVASAINSAITQGIGVALGLQKKFSWTGVAGAGVGAAVGSFVPAESLLSNPSAANIAANTIKTTAVTLADAATRSLIDGSDFGDNIIAALPSAIGGLIGEALAGGAMAPRRVQGDPSDSPTQYADAGNVGSDANYNGGSVFSTALPCGPGQRHSIWDGLKDGFGDLFGFDNSSFNPSNVGLNAHNQDEFDEIVVTAMRNTRDAARDFAHTLAGVAAATRQLGFGINDTVQETVVRPSVGLSNWVVTTVRDPGAGMRQFGGFTRDTLHGIDAFARDPLERVAVKAGRIRSDGCSWRILRV